LCAALKPERSLPAAILLSAQCVKGSGIFLRVDVADVTGGTFPSYQCVGDVEAGLASLLHSSAGTRVTCPGTADLDEGFVRAADGLTRVAAILRTVRDDYRRAPAALNIR